LSDTTSPSSEFTFVAVGSVMFQRRPSVETRPGFLELLELVRGADAAFLNLEAPIFEPAAYPVKQYIFSSYVTAEPWVAEELAHAGFNLVSLANNHVSDWSPEAAETNWRLLDAAGLVPTGVGATLAEARAPGYLDTAAGRVALISVDSSYEYGEFKQVQMASDPHGEVRGRPGVNGLRWHTDYELDDARFDQLSAIHEALELQREGVETAHTPPARGQDVLRFGGLGIRRGSGPGVTTRCDRGDLDQILRWVRTARSQADYVVVSHHTHSAKGEEWQFPGDYAREFAHAVIDVGADTYIGHGFTPKGVELYRGRPIFHDVGKLCHQDSSARRHPGDAYHFWELGADATPGEFADAREKGWERATADQEKFYEAFAHSVVVRLHFEDGALRSAELHPNKTTGGARHEREVPGLIHGAEAELCLDHFRRASEPFGTEILTENGVGKLKLAAEHA
jgi:poly-gamma-glutamate synthesis protein (capsule biosynthesis protein)